jgi:hypothetical protein
MAANSLNLPVDLEDLALELGAAVHHPDGSVFNSSGRKGVQRLKAVPTPSPAPAPEQPPVAQPDNSALIQALMQMVQETRGQSPVIQSAPAQVVVQPPARCSWDFTFTRNRDGSIQSIHATPSAL